MLNKKKKNLKEEVEYLTGEAAEQRLQDLRNKWEMDRVSEINYATEQGEKCGKKEGKKLGEQGIIRTLFKNNMSVEEIAEKTGIKLTEVLKIVNC